MRLDVAVILTVVVVAYVVVPRVAGLLEAVGGYNPGHFEPKDAERGAWLQRAPEPDAVGTRIPWQTVLHVALFLLVAVVWLTLLPARVQRRPDPPPPR